MLQTPGVERGLIKQGDFQVKVMLINPDSNLAKHSHKYRKFVTPLPPLSIAYIAVVLEKNGIDVIVADQYANKVDNEELVKQILEKNPQVVGISCLTAAMDNVTELVNLIKASSKSIKIVLGNIHATVFADELLKQGLADIIVRGEGEYGMLEVAQAIKAGEKLHGIKGISFIENNAVIHNPERELIEDLDTLPLPAWHLFDMRYYRGCSRIALHNKKGLPIMASRGCPFQCVFCSQDRLYKKSRYRRVKEIVDEIEYFHTRFKIEFVGFHDAYFPFSIEQGFEFCDEMIKRGLHKKVKWFTETRVDRVSPKLLIRMKESGLHIIFYGFEVGNQKILDSSKKGTTLEQARRAMKASKEAGIITFGLFMIGLPGETRETCEETIRFAKELDPDICKFNITVPYPGSYFFAEHKDKLRDQNPKKFTSWYDWSGFSGDLIYTPDNITSDELRWLQRKAMFDFYMRPKILIRHLKINPFKDLCYGAWVLISGYVRIFFDKITNFIVGNDI